MRFRLTGPSGAVIDEGEGTAEFTSGALVVAASGRPPLRVLPADIVELAEIEQPYGLSLRLAEGPVLQLTMLGRMRGQLFADLRDARGEKLTGKLAAGGIGGPEVFSGAVDGVPAEFRLYDDALTVVPTAGGDPERFPYPFLSGVDTDPSGYQLMIGVHGRGPLVVHRLARRTTEFRSLLEERITASSVRTSAFLGALLPGLGTLALGSAASALRDGLAAPRAALDAIDPTIWPSLISAATLPDRRACVRRLESVGEMWLGFAQTTSVERAAVGVQPWVDSSRTPNFYGHGGDGVGYGGFGGFGGFGGMLRGEMLAGGPSPALFLLGYMGSAGGPAHVIQPRADVQRGRLTPATTDYDALTVGGTDPAVLAFVFCQIPDGRVCYEVLNKPDHATYVYRSRDVSEINRALDLIRFRVSAVYAEDSAGSEHRLAIQRSPALRVLRDAFERRVIHGPSWSL